MSMFNDLQKVRKERTKEAASHIVRQLKKDGTPSKMHSATTYYRSFEDAMEYIDRLVKLNPGRLTHTMFQIETK